LKTIETSRLTRSAPRIHRLFGYFLILLSSIALLAVLSGYSHPLPPDEGAAAHIFELSILALVPTTLLFLATADWKRAARCLSPLAFSVGTLILAFCALYYLEHR